MTDQLAADLLAALPDEIRGRPGTALYSGREAWVGPSLIYLLGFNPGGSHADAPVSEQVAETLSKSDFSKYVNEEWEIRGRLKSRGEHFHQRRVRHLLDHLSLDPSRVPTSNLIFVRSRTVATLEEDDSVLAAACWPFHAAMIERLKPRAVVCLGKDAANFVKDRLEAHRDITAQFIVDDSSPRFAGVFSSDRLSGPTVVRLAHPSRFDWTTSAYDPRALVARVLEA